MTKKENLFQEHFNLSAFEFKSYDDTIHLATEQTNITLAYHKKCLELILEEWTKGKFQEPLSAIIRKEIEGLNK